MQSVRTGFYGEGLLPLSRFSSSGDSCFLASSIHIAMFRACSSYSLFNAYQDFNLKFCGGDIYHLVHFSCPMPRGQILLLQDRLFGQFKLIRSAISSFNFP